MLNAIGSRHDDIGPLYRPSPFFGGDLRVTGRRLKLVGGSAMPTAQPTGSFFLIIADLDQGLFSVEGPMTDDQPWKQAALNARNNHRRIECGPASPDRDTLGADYHRAHKLAGVPPGTLLRARR